MKQIVPGLFQVSMGPVNVFLIEDDRGLTLVDTSFKGDTEKIFNAIRKGGKDPQKIRNIVLTHSHPDHSGSAAEIRRRLNIPVFAHPEDAALIRQGLAGRLPHDASKDPLNFILFHLFIKKSPNETEAFEVDEKVNDGDVIPVAGGLNVIHTPGHSKGHICFLIKEKGVLIAGDICQNMIGLNSSTVYEDRKEGMESIRKASAFDFDTAVFGHGNALRNGANRKIAQYFRNR